MNNYKQIANLLDDCCLLVNKNVKSSLPKSSPHQVGWSILNPIALYFLSVSSAHQKSRYIGSIMVQIYWRKMNPLLTYIYQILSTCNTDYIIKMQFRFDFEEYMSADVPTTICPAKNWYIWVYSARQQLYNIVQ